MTISRNLSILAEGASSSGVLSVAYGGTGLSSTPANGALDIGNGTNFTRTTLTQGTGMTITNGAGSITIANAGVTSAVASTGISVSGATGAVTFTNTGVTSAVAGTGISVSGATGAVTITNSGVTSAVAGTGVSVSAGTGAVTISIGQSVATSATPTFGGMTLTGDITTYRSGAPTTGVIYLGNSGTRYLYYDGANYTLAGSNLYINGYLAVISNGGTYSLNVTGSAGSLSSTLAVSSGGTGLTATPTNGQIDIGNGSGFTRTTLTAGSGISISNGAGSITISGSAVTPTALAVGAYTNAQANTGSAPGDTTAGSNLRVYNCNSGTSQLLTGTWQFMGNASFSQYGNIWYRIA